MDDTFIQTSALPWYLPECPGSPVSRRPNTRGARGVGAHLEAYSDLGATPRAMDPRRCGSGRGDVPAGSPARRAAVSRTRRAGRPDGRSAAEAAETPRYPSTSCHCRDGLWTAARWLCALDDPRDDG